MASPRSVAVAIPVVCPNLASGGNFSLNDMRIYLVSSRKHAGRYVLPKGGVERGESSRQAAVRELWEEAGLLANPATPGATISRSTAEQLTIDDHKPHKLSPAKTAQEPGFVPRARYYGHELILTAEPTKEWPEAHERTRSAFTLAEAERQLEWRKDIHSIFKAWLSHIPSQP